MTTPAKDRQQDQAGTLAVRSDRDVVAVRQLGRQLADSLGFSRSDQALIATAISELARNIVVYAGSGTMALKAIEGRRGSGLQIVAQDSGQGIEDIEAAMTDGYSTGQSLGLGLPGTRRIVDDFDLVTLPGQGVTVTAVKWLRA